jgi:hypothetical protein
MKVFHRQIFVPFIDTKNTHQSLPTQKRIENNHIINTGSIRDLYKIASVYNGLIQ